jgi:hypothetical protein
MRNGKKLPKNFQRLLWSYDLKKMNAWEDKKEIITRVLNHGTWDDLKLLFKLYSEDDIKKTIKHPRRGVWFEKVLNFWTTIFNIRLKRDVWEKAIFNINPH